METAGNLFPSLKIHLGKEHWWSLLFGRRETSNIRLVLERGFESMQERLFNELGVICPKGQVLVVTDLPPGTVRLRIDDQPLDPITSKGPDWIVSEVEGTIRGHAGKLLSSELVEYYLDVLRETVPVIVEITLERYSVEGLTHELRARLDAGSSIRNLPAILEELLEARSRQK